ncbi:MAG: hypothetical protein GY719_25635 [bacterium]|nr:hypothetical protein [bacterium]
MRQSKSWAKRLLREMPADPAALLRRAAYRKPPFLRLYFEHVDGLIFDDPSGAMPWAAVAPMLALAVPLDGQGGEAKREHAENLAMGHAILASAYRAAGEHDRADVEYRTALEVADSGAVSKPVRASIGARLACLRACQYQLEEALDLATEAVELCRDAAEALGLCQALVVRGYVLSECGRFNDAIPCHAEALTLANPKQPAGARAHHAAIHDLAYALLEKESPKPAVLRGALAQVRAARKLLRRHRDSVPRHKLGWIEGLIWWRLNLHARAEQALKVALRGFVRLALPYEIALVSLDLAALHAFFGEHGTAALVARAAYRHCLALTADDEALAALKLWADAVQADELTDTVAGDARRAVEARVGPSGSRKERSQ